MFWGELGEWEMEFQLVIFFLSIFEMYAVLTLRKQLIFNLKKEGKKKAGIILKKSNPKMTTQETLCRDWLKMADSKLAHLSLPIPNPYK